MPRVEIRKPTHREGEASPTVDICNHCYHDLGLHNFSEGESVPNELVECADAVETGDALGSLDVEHPCYGDDDVDCCMCEDPLDEDDNDVQSPSLDDTDLEDDDFDDDDEEEDDEEDEYDT